MFWNDLWPVMRCGPTKSFSELIIFKKVLRNRVTKITNFSIQLKDKVIQFNGDLGVANTSKEIRISVSGKNTKMGKKVKITHLKSY